MKMRLLNVYTRMRRNIRNSKKTIDAGTILLIRPTNKENHKIILFFPILSNKMRVGPQMTKEKKAEKEVFQHLTEYVNGRISIGRMLKWPKSTRALVSVHFIWIRPISPCNCLAKKGLQDGGEHFYSFRKNYTLCMNLNFF
jgi:hypothetical protein